MYKGKKIIDNLLKSTLTNDIDWHYMDESDPFYESDKEQYYTEYKIEKGKKLDILLTKMFFNGFQNYFIKLYLNTNKNNIFINQFFYQDHYNLFDLFAEAKYYSAIKNDDYLMELKQDLYLNWDKMNWIKSGENFYKTILEKKNNKSINLIISKRIINIYMEENDKDPIFINTIEDQILYRILYENIKK